MTETVIKKYDIITLSFKREYLLKNIIELLHLIVSTKAIHASLLPPVTTIIKR
jgi:hypothetical protein